MEVFVITKHYEHYDESYTEVIGVRETKLEAEALIVKERLSNDHPLCTAKDWYDGWKSFYSTTERLIREENNGPKKGGWIRKYRREQLPQEDRLLYDRLSDISGEMSFPEFWRLTRKKPEHMTLLEDFFYSPLRGLSPEKRKEVEEFFSTDRQPERFTYSINAYETKPSFKIEEQQ